MRYQGKITHWKDDQGFGFITPEGGGKQVFVHIKSFLNRKRRPAGKEIVTYELKTDAKGRAQAENIAFVGEHIAGTSSPKRNTASLTFITLFLVFVAASVFVGKLPFEVLG